MFLNSTYSPYYLTILIGRHLSHYSPIGCCLTHVRQLSTWLLAGVRKYDHTQQGSVFKRMVNGPLGKEPRAKLLQLLLLHYNSSTYTHAPTHALRGNIDIYSRHLNAREHSNATFIYTLYYNSLCLLAYSFDTHGYI